MANNLGTNTYTVGGDYDAWGNKIIADFASINTALGDTATITATSGTVTLTQEQNNAAIHRLTGSLTGNMIVECLSSKGRIWYVNNATNGAFTVTYRVAGGAGASVMIDQSKSAVVSTDGADCHKLDITTLGGFLDENDLGSNSATEVPSQRSVKTYVDNAGLSSEFPGQAGNSGKFLTTNGENASWADVAYTSIRPVVVTAVGVTATAGQRIFASGTTTITTPLNPVDGTTFYVQPTGLAVTISRNAIGTATTIEGETSVTIDQAGVGVELTCVNNVWKIERRSIVNG